MRLSQGTSNQTASLEGPDAPRKLVSLSYLPVIQWQNHYANLTKQGLCWPTERTQRGISMRFVDFEPQKFNLDLNSPSHFQLISTCRRNSLNCNVTVVSPSPLGLPSLHFSFPNHCHSLAFTLPASCVQKHLLLRTGVLSYGTEHPTDTSPHTCTSPRYERSHSKGH